MTSLDIGSFIEQGTTRSYDRGGRKMNLLFIETLVNLDHKGKGKNDPAIKVDDYGYALYQSLEYNIKHARSADGEFRENPLYVTIIR